VTLFYSHFYTLYQCAMKKIPGFDLVVNRSVSGVENCFSGPPPYLIMTIQSFQISELLYDSLTKKEYYPKVWRYSAFENMHSGSFTERRMGP
jgi:hypothetical protein